MKCKWYFERDYACANSKCPYGGDICPTREHPEACRYAEEKPEPELNTEELVTALRNCANEEGECKNCPYVHLSESGICCDDCLKRKAADMLEKLAAEKDAKKPEWIEQQRTAISAIETCRQLKKSLFEKENVTNDELVRMVLQLKSGDTKIEKERKRRKNDENA